MTSEEKERKSGIQSKTIKEINEIIVKAIDQPPNDIASVMEDDYRKNFKRKAKKGALIELFHRIQEELDIDEDDSIDDQENCKD